MTEDQAEAQTGGRLYLCGDVNKSVTGHDVATTGQSIVQDCEFEGAAGYFVSGVKTVGNGTYLYIMADQPSVSSNTLAPGANQAAQMAMEQNGDGHYSSEDLNGYSSSVGGNGPPESSDSS